MGVVLGGWKRKWETTILYWGYIGRITLKPEVQVEATKLGLLKSLEFRLQQLSACDL